MTSNKWTFEYKDLPWANMHPLGKSEGKGFYKINFNGLTYGFISKDAWNEEKTGELLALVIKMLNDAYDLAIRDINKE